MDILDELQNDAEVFRRRPIGFILQCAIDEIERLRSLTTWQPIETAPKDGTRILACEEDDAGWWSEVVSWGLTYPFGETHGWVTYATGPNPDNMKMDATHWLPLPSPPES